MYPIFTLMPINNFISEISLNPFVWMNNENDLYRYTYLLTVHGLELYNELPLELKNKIDNKFSGLKFRLNYINQYQYPTAYDFLNNIYLFDTNKFDLNKFMIDLISRFLLIHKYYNSYKNKDDNILENIDEIKKILKELNKEASEDESLIDEIIAKILEKKKAKLIDFYYTESRKTIKKLLKKIMLNKNDITAESYSAKKFIERVQKECSK
jgi:hypothetical protein